MGGDYYYDSTALSLSIESPNDPGDKLDIPANNLPPAATVDAKRFAASQAGKPQAVLDQIHVSDPNYEIARLYSFRNSSPDPSSGYFLYKGQSYQGVDLTDVPAKDLDNVSYVPASADSQIPGEQIRIQANDGKAWSPWSQPVTWSTSENRSPEVDNGNQYFSARSWNERIPIATLFQASDPDDDPIQSYNFWNGKKDGSGYFYYKRDVYQLSLIHI